VLTASGAELPIAWTVDPRPLLEGKARTAPTPVSERSARGGARGRERIELRDVDLALPVPLLSEIVGGRLAHRGASPTATSRCAAARLIPLTINGDLNVLWRNARRCPPFPRRPRRRHPRLRADGGGSPARDNSGGVMDIRDVTVFPDKRAAVSLLPAPCRTDDALPPARSAPSAGQAAAGA
jgi:hypothetical protein